jgi:hypothetical protein
VVVLRSPPCSCQWWSRDAGPCMCVCFDHACNSARRRVSAKRSWRNVRSWKVACNEDQLVCTSMHMYVRVRMRICLQVCRELINFKTKQTLFILLIDRVLHVWRTRQNVVYHTICIIRSKRTCKNTCRHEDVHTHTCSRNMHLS